MPAIDVDKYLRPISPEAPCGDDLEYDAAFAELGRSAISTAERIVGGNVTPASEPNWSDVFRQAEDLLGRTRDLRVVVLLINAGLKIDGLPALADGLKLITGLCKTYWKEVHPRLDPDDGDATLRLNSLLELEARPIPGAEKQPPSLLRHLDDAPLVRAKLAGTFSRRQLKLAKGELAAPTGTEPPSLVLIEAAFLETNLDELQATAKAAKDSIASLKELKANLSDMVGAQRAPELANLRKELESIDRIVSEQLAQRGVAGTTTPSGDGGVAAPPSAGRIDGEIRSREDVVQILDRLCDYFRKNEPSSPVPLLLQRAKRLVAKDFLAILRDLTPGGVDFVGSEDQSK